MSIKIRELVDIRILCQVVVIVKKLSHMHEFQTSVIKSIFEISYSCLSNKRAGWNKRAGRKFCPILGNFESLNSCRVDLCHFQRRKWLVMAKISINTSNGNEINAANHKLGKI